MVFCLFAPGCRPADKGYPTLRRRKQRPGSWSANEPKLGRGNPMKQLIALMALIAALGVSLAVPACAPATPEEADRQVLDGIATDLAAVKDRLDALNRVAVIRVSAYGTTREGEHLVGPTYYLQGSTIPGFHQDAEYDVDITTANPNQGRELDSRELPEGHYLVELEQPRPAVESGCASDEYGLDCEPMRFVVSSPPTGWSGNINRGSDARTDDATGAEPPLAKVLRHAGVIHIDGTKLSHFFVAFAVRSDLVTASRPASSFSGKVTITKLQ